MARDLLEHLKQSGSPPPALSEMMKPLLGPAFTMQGRSDDGMTRSRRTPERMAGVNPLLAGGSLQAGGQERAGLLMVFREALVPVVRMLERILGVLTGQAAGRMVAHQPAREPSTGRPAVESMRAAPTPPRPDFGHKPLAPEERPTGMPPTPPARSVIAPPPASPLAPGAPGAVPQPIGGTAQRGVAPPPRQPPPPPPSVPAQGQDVSPVLAKVIGGLDKAADAIGPVMDRMAKAAVGTGKFVATKARALGRAVKAGAKVAVRDGPRKLKGIGQSIRSLPGGMKKAGGMAAGHIGAVIGMFQQAVGAAKGFVEALNPSSVQVLDRAMRDLYATIGVALQPVIMAASGVIKDFSAALLPVMEKLKPVIESLMQSFMQVAEVWINTFAGIATQLIPVFKFLADVVSAAVPAFQAFYAHLSGLFEVLAGLFKSATSGIDFKSITDTMKDAVRTLSSYMLQAVTHLLKFIDALAGSSLALNYVKGVKKGLLGEGVEKKSAEGLAAPTGASTGDIRGFSSQITQAAYSATPGRMVSKDDELKAHNQKMVKILENIANNVGKSPLEAKMEKLEEMIRLRLDQLIDAAKGTVYEGIKQAGKDVAMGPSVSTSTFRGWFGQ